MSAKPTPEQMLAFMRAVRPLVPDGRPPLICSPIKGRVLPVGVEAGRGICVACGCGVWITSTTLPFAESGQFAPVCDVCAHGAVLRAGLFAPGTSSDVVQAGGKQVGEEFGGAVVVGRLEKKP